MAEHPFLDFLYFVVKIAGGCFALKVICDTIQAYFTKVNKKDKEKEKSEYEYE